MSGKLDLVLVVASKCAMGSEVLLTLSSQQGGIWVWRDRTGMFRSDGMNVGTRSVMERGFSACSAFMDKLNPLFADLELSQVPTFKPQPPPISLFPSFREIPAAVLRCWVRQRGMHNPVLPLPQLETTEELQGSTEMCKSALSCCCWLRWGAREAPQQLLRVWIAQQCPNAWGWEDEEGGDSTVAPWGCCAGCGDTGGQGPGWLCVPVPNRCEQSRVRFPTAPGERR